jgi:general secretion pathway protein D
MLQNSRLPRLLLCLFLVCSLAACAIDYPDDEIDPTGNLTRKDYIALRERGKPHKEKRKKKDEGDFPSLPMEAEPSSQPLTPMAAVPPVPDLPPPPRRIAKEGERERLDNLVSIQVTDTTPLREIFIELGREGRVNMEIDPRIEGGVIFSAHDQPFETVLRRICDLAGLRYIKDSSFVRVELDEPYQQSYPLDYLSLTRQTNSEVSIATNVFDVDVGSGNNGSSGDGNNQSGDNNSTAKISGKAEADFWQNVGKSLPQILASSRGKLSAHDEKSESNFSIDRQAGLVTVYGNSRQQRAVEDYLRKLYTKASAQVLIEARIVEVELNEEFKSGINWSEVFDDTLGIAANFGAPGLGAAMTAASSGLFTTAVDTGDFKGLMNLVRTFGTTRVLSSPRLTVINNQTAVLKVARNEVYFVTTAQFPTTVNSNGVAVNGTPVFSSTPRTVPVGLIMTVQPSINPKNNRITMTLRPTISRVIDRVADPSIGLNAANAGVTGAVDSKIPVLAVREMDSVLQLQSGEVAVMGGLMQDSSENQDQGVPPFDTAPLIGELAKSRSNNGKTSELVILLRATILKNAQPDKADKDVYENYNRDPRPIEFPDT